MRACDGTKGQSDRSEDLLHSHAQTGGLIEVRFKRNCCIFIRWSSTFLAGSESIDVQRPLGPGRAEE